jgi:hypothetical protein
MLISTFTALSCILTTEGPEKQETVELRYKHIEAALAEVLEVRPKGLGAFRARLRHLRNLGLPRLPKPGSGQHIIYTRRQALEMLVAAELEKVGQTPKSVAILAQSIVGQSPYGRYRGKDCYVAISEARPGYTMAYGLRAFTEMMKSAPDVFLVINVSACVRKLDPALDRALAGD